MEDILNSIYELPVFWQVTLGVTAGLLIFSILKKALKLTVILLIIAALIIFVV